MSAGTRRIAVPLLLAVFVAGALLSGCRYHRRHHPYVVDGYSDFYYEASLHNDTDVELYSWDFAFDRAIVEFEAFNFDGEFLIEIFDDHDVLVYQRLFFGDGGDYEFERDETDDGDEGDWHVRVTTTNVDGFIRFAVF
ncbi:MAG: hypothetical protein L0Z55_12615 [Planctomycetes bacterium]|nr:hypothetical protein [Planctomycetota bacterium]